MPCMSGTTALSSSRTALGEPNQSGCWIPLPQGLVQVWRAWGGEGQQTSAGRHHQDSEVGEQTGQSTTVELREIPCKQKRNTVSYHHTCKKQKNKKQVWVRVKARAWGGQEVPQGAGSSVLGRVCDRRVTQENENQGSAPASAPAFPHRTPALQRHLCLPTRRVAKAVCLSTAALSVGREIVGETKYSSPWEGARSGLATALSWANSVGSSAGVHRRAPDRVLQDRHFVWITAHAHTHSHTCTVTHTRTCTFAHVHTRTRARTPTHTCSHTQIDTHTCTHAHTCIHTRTHMCTHVHKHILTNRHTRTHVHTLTHLHTCAHMFAHTDTHTCIHTHRHVHTLHSHTHADTHACAHMHVHTRTRPPQEARPQQRSVAILCAVCEQANEGGNGARACS